MELAASFPADIMDFSPSADLPAGVKYTLTDDAEGNWNSASFNGQVNAEDRYSGLVTFTQTFYLNGVDIVGERIVVMNTIPVENFGFLEIESNSGTDGITLEHP